MIGSLVQEYETKVVGIILDTYIFMTYKDVNDRQIVERDYFVKWNNGETYWISADKVKILSKKSS
tara:strand:- start:59 stop:253 length:195 start_codon:yes stop_codon:yes gene_type:complete